MVVIYNPKFNEKTSYTELIRKLHDAEKRAETAEKENTQIIAQNKNLQELLKPFQAPYFENLTAGEIAALAKVSLSVKVQNRNMQNAFIDLSECFNKAKETGTYDDYKLAIEKGIEACRKFNPFTQVIKEG